MASAKFRIKIAFRIVTLFALVAFIVLQLVNRRPLRVRLKPASELQKLPILQDSYPCLMVERRTPSADLSASVRECLPDLDAEADIEQYEVDLRSGLFILRKTDLFLSDSMPLALTRAYRLWDSHVRAFGIGSNHDYDIFPTGDHFPYTYMDLNLGDGRTVRYNRISQGSSYADFWAEHNSNTSSEFQKSRVRWNTDHWELTLHDGTLITLPDSYQASRAAQGAPIGIRRTNGEEIRCLRDQRHNLVRLTSPHNRRIQLLYDSNDRITQAADDTGRVLEYFYDPAGRLAEVRENGLLQFRYSYDPFGMTQVEDAGRHTLIGNQYSRGRIASLSVAGAGIYHLDYLVTASGKVEETILTEPTGKASRFMF
jgi:YD repeat-containing protein